MGLIPRVSGEGPSTSHPASNVTPKVRKPHATTDEADAFERFNLKVLMHFPFVL